MMTKLSWVKFGGDTLSGLGARADTWALFSLRLIVLNIHYSPPLRSLRSLRGGKNDMDFYFLT